MPTTLNHEDMAALGRILRNDGHGQYDAALGRWWWGDALNPSADEHLMSGGSIDANPDIEAWERTVRQPGIEKWNTLHSHVLDIADELHRNLDSHEAQCSFCHHVQMQCHECPLRTDSAHICNEAWDDFHNVLGTIKQELNLLARHAQRLRTTIATVPNPYR